MAAFDATIARGRAILEGRTVPELKMGRGVGKRWTLAMLQDEARRNPRVHVAIRVGGQLIPTVYEPAAAPHTEETTMKSEQNTISGVCRACGLIGVTIVHGRTLAHTDRNGTACDGEKAAPMPSPAGAPFAPRCGCKGKGTCRVCRMGSRAAAAPMAYTVSAAQILAASQPDTRAVAAQAPVARRASRPVASNPVRVQTHHVTCKCDDCQIGRGIVGFLVGIADALDRPLPRLPSVQLAAPTGKGIRVMVEGDKGELIPIAAAPSASELLATNVRIARVIVETFQAYRDEAHASEVERLKDRIEAAHVRQRDMQEDLDATHAALHKALAPVAGVCRMCGYMGSIPTVNGVPIAQPDTLRPLIGRSDAAGHTCYLCKKTAVMGYILEGKVCCRDCRGAHREARYADRGQVAPVRQARTFGKHVANLIIHADRCEVITAAKS